MPPRAYRTVTAQTLHYFARAHSRVPATAVGGPASWLAAEHREPSGWTHVLTGEELAALERALDAPAAAGKPLAALTAEDVPLGPLAPRVPEWRRILNHGRGFLRIRGLPVMDWGQERCERLFWALGHHLGMAGAQNGDGDLLGHVRDLREQLTRRVRQYRTNENIRFHCDAADAVGLLCLHPAKSGGLSRIASSVAIFDRLVSEDPLLAAQLFEPIYLDTRMDAGVDAVRIVPAAFHAGQLRTFYHAEYFRTAPEHPGVPALSERQRALLDRYDALANDPAFHLEMELQAGDIQLISNHTVVHARTGFEDHPEPARRRHLLRLWLSLETPPGIAVQARRAWNLAPVLVSLARRRRAVKRRRR